MKRSIFFVLIVTAAIGSIHAQETGEQAVSNADILKSLEEINQRLDKIQPTALERTAIKNGLLTVSLFPLFMPEVQKINDYLAAQGSFGPINMYFVPIMNGFSLNGRLELTSAPNFWILVDTYRWGQVSQGFLSHSLNPLYTDAVTGAGDGLVDYYSSIEYSMSGFDLGAAYTFEIAKDAFSVTPGFTVGYGGDRLMTCEWGASPMSLLFSDATWNKPYFSAGACLVMDLFGLTIGGNFDYHVNLTGWQPGSGTASASVPPAADFNYYSFRFWVNPTGLLANLLASK